jgi:hypothetical protein
MLTQNLVLSTLVAATLATAATEVSHSRYRNETARVEYSWIENGCVSKQLVVMAARNSVRTDGTTDVTPVSTVMYSIYDFCDLTNVSQTFWWGRSDTFALTVDSNLKDASLTSPAFLVAGERYNGLVRTDLGTKSLSLNISWTSKDPMYRTASTFVTQLPGYQEVSHLTGQYRLATATGVVSDGTQNWFPNAFEGNLVQIFRLNEGETIITKE